MLRVSLVAAALLFIAQPAVAEPTNVFSTLRGLRGLPTAAAPRLQADPHPAAFTTALDGVYVVNIAIAVKSPLATNPPIKCLVTLQSDIGRSTYNEAEEVENATVDATRNGNTASCSVRIPYKWQIPADAVVKYLSIGVSLYNYVDTMNMPSAALSRQSSQSLGVPYPANGATTTVNVNAAL